MVLVAHRDAGFRRQLVRAFVARAEVPGAARLDVKTCESAESALSICQSAPVAAALVGAELFADRPALRKALASTPLVLSLGAVEAVALPANVAAVIDEGTTIDRAVFAIERALMVRDLEKKASRVAAPAVPEPVVASKPMRTLLAKVKGFAASRQPVLFLGEKGSGRESFARWLQAKGGGDELVVVRAGVDAETDVARTLASVAASRQKTTLLLFSIEATSPAAQDGLRALIAPPAKHLRVIATASADLRERVRDGAFPRELFLAFGGGLCELPPLRSRRDDIPVLASHFLREATRGDESRFYRIGAEAMKALRRAAWPGNVSELEAAIRHAILVSKTGSIVPGDLPEIDGSTKAIRLGLGEEDYAEARAAALRAFETAYVAELLERTQGNLAQAARAAGMDRANFRRLVLRVDPAQVPGKASTKRRGVAIRPFARDPDDS